MPHCLGSVAGLFDEIVVVNTGSTDRTREIAREFGARVFDFVWVNDFAATRNAALARAKSGCFRCARTCAGRMRCTSRSCRRCGGRMSRCAGPMSTSGTPATSRQAVSGRRPQLQPERFSRDTANPAPTGKRPRVFPGTFCPELTLFSPKPSVMRGRLGRHSSI